MATTTRKKHYHYLEPERELCHFYRHCSKIKGSLVEIDSEKYAREYICKFDNNYQICESCSKINERQLCEVMLAIITAMAVFALLPRDMFTGVRASKLWITSPQGKHYQISHYRALRIARKHGWGITETIPKLSRWQAIKYITSAKIGKVE